MIALPPGTTELPSGTRFGDYVLFEELGRGGFGIVWRARRVDELVDVALKRPLNLALASDEERNEFLRGARLAGELKHPHIPRVHTIGEAEGCLYFTMEYISGVDLERVLDMHDLTVGRAARLLHEVASAVAHAHSVGVMHRDLKPQNVLVDRSDKAWVIDFGMAKRLTKLDSSGKSERTRLSHYLAPEQAAGRHGRHSADIWAIGAVLYEVLTGLAPYEGLPLLPRLVELTSAEPVGFPRFGLPATHDLKRICGQCLKKNPERRYRSAAELAEDLECVATRKPPRHLESEPVLRRVGDWLWRRPLHLAIALTLSFLAALAASTSFILSRSASAAEQQALQTNAFFATTDALALLYRLRELGDRVDHATREPKLIALLQQPSLSAESDDLSRLAEGFEALYVALPSGRLMAQWPTWPARHIIGKNFEFRDYFRGASALGARGERGLYLGRAYSSESKGEFQFSISAPVFDDSNRWVGNAVGGLAADSTMGRARVQGPAQSERSVALLGPRDNDRLTADRPLPGGLYFVVHPRLRHGQEFASATLPKAVLAPEFAHNAGPGRQWSLRPTEPHLETDYRDTLDGSNEGFLAAFAPVGETGYVVVVQTRRDAVSGTTRRLAHATLLGAALAVMLAGLLLLLLERLRRLRLYTAGGARV